MPLPPPMPRPTAAANDDESTFYQGEDTKPLTGLGINAGAGQRRGLTEAQLKLIETLPGLAFDRIPGLRTPEPAPAAESAAPVAMAPAAPAAAPGPSEPAAPPLLAQKNVPNLSLASNGPVGYSMPPRPKPDWVPSLQFDALPGYAGPGNNPAAAKQPAAASSQGAGSSTDPVVGAGAGGATKPAAPAKPAVQPPKQAGAISGLNGRATGGTAGAGASGAAVRASAKPAGARPGGGLDFLARLEAVEKAEEAGMNGGAAAAPAGDSAALTVEVPTDANGASGPAGASTLTGGAKPSASNAKLATKAADRQASKSKSSSVAREKSNGVSREKSNSGSAATAAPGRRFSASSGRGAAAAAAAAAAAGGRGGAAGRGGRGSQCRGRSQVEASCHAHALVCALPPLPFG